MTVSELIELMHNFNGDTEVLFGTSESIWESIYDASEQSDDDGYYIVLNAE